MGPVGMGKSPFQWVMLLMFIDFGADTYSIASSLAVTGLIQRNLQRTPSCSCCCKVYENIGKMYMYICIYIYISIFPSTNPVTVHSTG